MAKVVSAKDQIKDQILDPTKRDLGTIGIALVKAAKNA